MTLPVTRSRSGMTLIEMMLALLIFSFVMAGAMGILRAESRSFQLGSERVAMNQNGRFAVNEMEKDLRTSGAGSPDIQPQMIYVSDSVIAFNANYWTNTAGDVEAVYYNPDAPDSAVLALRKSTQITIPYTSILYPDTNYLSGGINSAAETIIFYFMVDTSTSRTDDYILYRKVNKLAPEVVSTNILKTTGVAFFQYFKITTAAGTGVQTMSVVSSGLPWRHITPIHLASNDTGVLARIDSLRAVRVNFTVSNGLAGTAERRRAVSRLIRLPNMGLANTRSCGDAPFPPLVPVAANAFAPDGITPIVSVTFNQSVDETTGEEDVERYVIWRRLSSDTDWGDPYVTLPGGTASYDYSDAAITSGLTYVYGIAAQDCTPTVSSLASTNTVTIP